MCVQFKAFQSTKILVLCQSPNVWACLLWTRPNGSSLRAATAVSFNEERVTAMTLRFHSFLRSLQLRLKYFLESKQRSKSAERYELIVFSQSQHCSRQWLTDLGRPFSGCWFEGGGRWWEREGTGVECLPASARLAERRWLPPPQPPPHLLSLHIQVWTLDFSPTTRLGFLSSEGELYFSLSLFWFVPRAWWFKGWLKLNGN